MSNTEIRARLQVLQGELQERLHRIETEQQERNAPDNDQWSDQASLHERDAEQFAVQVATRAELNQVNEALMRLDANMYGVCETCGEEIEPARLNALPFASRCMKHAD